MNETRRHGRDGETGPLAGDKPFENVISVLRPTIKSIDSQDFGRTDCNQVDQEHRLATSREEEIEGLAISPRSFALSEIRGPKDLAQSTFARTGPIVSMHVP